MVICSLQKKKKKKKKVVKITPRTGAGQSVGFLGRVETLGSNPPQVATGRVGAGRNPGTRQAITFG